MHIAIIQNWGLGDLVMTTPVISELRRTHPDAKLTLIVRGAAQAALMENSPLIDRIIKMPPRSERLGLVQFFMALRRERFDVAFIGTRISGYLAFIIRFVVGVPLVIGDGSKMRFAYRIRNEIDSNVHRVDRMLKTLELWTEERPQQPLFPIPRDPAALAESRAVLDAAQLTPGKFVILHPGSSASGGIDKRIPADVAMRVARNVLDRYDQLSVAYIFGPDELDYIPSFCDLGEREVILSGHSLSVTAAIISQATGLVGTDSSLGHIAAAFGVPSVTLAGPTIPSETRPYGNKARVVGRIPKLACQPCWGTPLYGHCPFDVRCMRELPEMEIVDYVSEWPVG